MDGKLWNTPRATATVPPSHRNGRHAEKTFRSSFLVSVVGAERWLHVRVNTTSCGESLEGVTPVEGWLPAYGSSGQTSAWFYSRGC
jgi:hypothetical protein